MFTRSYYLFSILGFRIGIDLSWFFLAALIIWSLGSGYFPYILPGLQTGAYYLIAAVAALGMFASIIFHELAHALVARYYDIKIGGITLFIFGGVAELEDEPPTAKSEFLVAIAGPISSYILAGAFYLVIQLLPLSLPDAVFALLAYLMLINLVLATFNLIPAFPLDGGRMLRAALWWFKGNLRQATKIASYLGAGLGIALMGFGAYNSFFLGSSVGGLWQILIGFFIFNAAGGARRQMEVMEALRGVKVHQLMKPLPHGIPAEIPVSEITRHPQLQGSKSYFAVVKDGQIAGLIQPLALEKVPEAEQAGTPVGSVASPLRPSEKLSPDQGAINALNQLRKARGHQAVVIVNDQMIGWIEARDIFGYFEERTAERKAREEQAST